MPGATILHVDLDAFFAAVEQRDRPELLGRPVVVGGDPQARGVVSAASYEARAFGVRSAMPLRTAAALCPQAVFLPVRAGRYAEVSRQVMAILRRFTPRVEQVSIDEAFLDVAGSETLHGSPEDIGRAIRSAIRAELGLGASVGVATTRLVAKVASDLRKPDALVVVLAGGEAGSSTRCPSRGSGVGAKTRAVLADHGVRTIGDLARLPRTSCGVASGRTAPPLPSGRRASTRRPWASTRTRAQSAMSTPLSRTAGTPRSSSARCWRCRRAWRRGFGWVACAPRRSRSRSGTLSS
ncbi:MAG: DNA polymerase IV [Chloroflexota bacterium]